MNYLVTGATGNIGALVVERLLSRGARPRVFVRDAEKARARFGDRVDVAVGDLGDVASLGAAFRNVDTVLLVNSGPGLDERDRIAATAASTLNIRHVVKLSSMDAREQNVGTGVWHARGEAAIRAQGIPFTFVQPSGFMINALYWAQSLKAEGVVRAATGDGKIPFIHSNDIADVVTAAMTDPRHVGKELPITGPESLSYPEMTAKLAAACDKPFKFVPISEDEARRQQVSWGASPEMVEARLSIFRAIRRGLLARVTNTVEQILGRSALTFDRWARENVAAFR
jgi:uncharacterized protein YbjT (DUF2867 family)